MPRQGVGENAIGLMILLDFLLGLSMEEVAQRYRTSRAAIEGELREVLFTYGFVARNAS